MGRGMRERIRRSAASVEAIGSAVGADRRTVTGCGGRNRAVFLPRGRAEICGVPRGDGDRTVPRLHRADRPARAPSLGVGAGAPGLCSHAPRVSASVLIGLRLPLFGREPPALATASPWRLYPQLGRSVRLRPAKIPFRRWSDSLRVRVVDIASTPPRSGGGGQLARTEPGRRPRVPDRREWPPGAGSAPSCAQASRHCSAHGPTSPRVPHRPNGIRGTVSRSPGPRLSARGPAAPATSAGSRRSCSRSGASPGASRPRSARTTPPDPD